MWKELAKETEDMDLKQLYLANAGLIEFDLLFVPDMKMLGHLLEATKEEK
jgi:hypothetical protein